MALRDTAGRPDDAYADEVLAHSDLHYPERRDKDAARTRRATARMNLEANIALEGPRAG